MKEQLEWMKSRLAEARESLVKAEKSADSDTARELIEKAQSLIGLVQFDIDRAKYTRMDDDTYEKLRQIVAEHASLGLRLNNLKSKRR